MQFKILEYEVYALKIINYKKSIRIISRTLYYRFLKTATRYILESSEYSYGLIVYK